MSRSLKLLPEKKNPIGISNTVHIGLENFCKLVVQSYYKHTQFWTKSLSIDTIVSEGAEYLKNVTKDQKEILLLQKSVKRLITNIKSSKKKGGMQMNEVPFYSLSNNRDSDGIDTEVHRNALFTFAGLQEVLSQLLPSSKKEFQKGSLAITDRLFESVKKNIEVIYSFDIDIKCVGDDSNYKKFEVELLADVSPGLSNPFFPSFEGYMRGTFEYSKSDKTLRYSRVDSNTLNIKDDFWKLMLNEFHPAKLEKGASKKVACALKLTSHKGKSKLRLSTTTSNTYKYLSCKGWSYTFERKVCELKDNDIYSFMGMYPSRFYNPIVYQSKEVTSDVIRFVDKFYDYDRLILFHVALADWFSKQNYTFPTLVESNTTYFSAKNLYSPTLVAADSVKVIPNNVVLSKAKSGKVITGRNAGGKTSYMDMIAISLLLAQNGFPVLAESATLSAFKNIHIHYIKPNSISIGESRFVEELSRVKRMISNVGAGDLVLLDEPFSGTSYKDGYNQLKKLLTVLSEVDSKVVCTTHISNIINHVDRISHFDNVHVNTRYKVVLGGDFSSHGSELADTQGLTLKEMREMIATSFAKKAQAALDEEEDETEYDEFDDDDY